MTRSPAGLFGAVLLGGAALLAQSQDQTPAKPAAAPTQAQSISQECYGWAKSNTGIDPQAPAPATAAAPEASKQGGQRLRGAARGAAAGAIVGEVADNGGDGAKAREDFKKALGQCLQGRGYTTG